MTRYFFNAILILTLTSDNKGVGVFKIFKLLFRKIISGLSNIRHYIWKRIDIPAKLRVLHRTHCFRYVLTAIVLIVLSFSGISYFPKTTTFSGIDYFGTAQASDFSPLLKNYDSKEGVLFSNQGSLVLEPPDLKIIGDNSLAAVSTPRIVSNQVLGSILGSSDQQRKEIVEYTVQSGDTFPSIASNFGISLNTLYWANELNKSSKISVGQKIVVPPVDGIIYFVKAGDTIPQIAKTYKASEDDMVSFNQLADEFDISIGDMLIIPGGVMPEKPQPAPQSTYLASNYFIFPAGGEITQGLHWYHAIDIANKCGTFIHAAAAGVVERAVSNGEWNAGMGNHITILHDNGTVTYYGHLMAVLVKPGDTVGLGENIALMGGAPGMAGAGDSTGCHVHFEVIGASNPLAKYRVHTWLKYADN